MDVDISRNNDETTRADFQLAIEANPTSSLLWNAYVAFERAKGDTNAANVETVQKRAAELGVECATTSSTHPVVL